MWGRWLRSRLASPADLQGVVAQSLLRTIARQAATTNMRLEGLLSEIKAAIPRRSSRGVHSEKQLHMGLISQLMKQHLGDGKDDVRAVTLRELVKGNVPVDVKAPAPRYQRPDTSWVMQRWHRWRVDHRDASADESRQQLQHLHTLWREMATQDWQCLAGFVASLQIESCWSLQASHHARVTSPIHSLQSG